MNILIRGKQIEVTDALRDYVNKRVGKLENFSDEFGDVQVTLHLVNALKGRYRVEVTAPIGAPIGGIILRGEEETEDMYSSIDLVMEKLEKQIEKYRTRISKRVKAKSLKNMERLDQAPAVTEEDELVVRRKKFFIKPITVEEAIMQMNLVGHSFYVFTNADTDLTSVVYRRKDGNYGLLEPQG